MTSSGRKEDNECQTYQREKKKKVSRITFHPFLSLNSIVNHDRNGENDTIEFESLAAVRFLFRICY